MTPFILMALATFLLGAVAMSVWVAITSSKKWHDKHHTHHSELMCDHCTHRYYRSGFALNEAMCRWPRRIMGSAAPRGLG